MSIEELKTWQIDFEVSLMTLITELNQNGLNYEAITDLIQISVNNCIKKYGSWDLVKDENNNNTLVTSNNYFKQTYFQYSCFPTYDDENYMQYVTNEEKTEIKRILKKYKNVGLTKDQVYSEYLEYGTSVYDIEDQIESELKMSEGNYEY